MDKKNTKKVLVLSIKETDEYMQICDAPYNLEVVGVYADIKEAAAEMNRKLVQRRAKLIEFYNRKCHDIREEMSQTIDDLANEPSVAQQGILRIIIDTLQEKEREYCDAMVPELLIVNDEEGDIREISVKDERAGWTCTLEVEKMEVIDSAND